MHTHTFVLEAKAGDLWYCTEVMAVVRDWSHNPNLVRAQSGLVQLVQAAGSKNSMDFSVDLNKQSLPNWSFFKLKKVIFNSKQNKPSTFGLSGYSCALPSICLSICPSVHLSIRQSVHLSVCHQARPGELWDYPFHYETQGQLRIFYPLSRFPFCGEIIGLKCKK